VTDGRKRSLATQIALPFVAAALLIGIGTLLLLVTGTESGATGDRIPLAALATWTLASVSLFTALAVLIAHRLSSRLRVVSEGARRVAEGDYSVRVDVPANTEIGELASGFNDMALALEERSESLTRKVLDLSTLHESSRALGSTLELDSLLERALDSALRVCGADTGYVTMLDGEAGTMEIRARRGFVPGHVSAAGDPHFDGRLGDA
jgi:HAMP domain-containing protein